MSRDDKDTCPRCGGPKRTTSQVCSPCWRKRQGAADSRAIQETAARWATWHRERQPLREGA